MVDLNRFHLNGLRAIEIVARQGTLARAADELGTSPGAVSQLVIKAEKQLGRQVFERLPSGLKLTPFGSELVAHLEAGFSALAKGVAGAIENQSQVLRVSTTLSFAEKWLVPRLPDFQTANPKILVQIDTGLAVKDLVQSDIDVALRFGKGNWPGTKAEHLCDYRVFPVCSPAYAKRLSTPADLSAATIIRYEGARESWEDWALAANVADPLPVGITFTEAALCINAAIAGLGAALGWDILLADELKEGRLVAPFDGYLVSEYGLWMVTSKSRGGDAKSSAFKLWMKQQLGK
jgi:LysR family transcriptional regulator, glycine cleavage system transcriptional activator